MSIRKARAVEACNAATVALQRAEAAFLESLFDGRRGGVEAFEGRLRDLETAERSLADCRG